MDPVVAISHLNYSYGPRRAIDDLSLDVSPGRIFGFLGPNGSGKTTLFRVLSTLIPAPRGSVRMFGLDPATHADAIRRRIGVVFQSPAVDKMLTAVENLKHHGHLYGLSGADLARRIETNLALVGLTDRASDRVGDFSGGMRRRVELAKGLLNQPDLLLLDEPSTGLDPSARLDLWATLSTLRDQGMTILLTTHLMEEADKCDTLAVMTAGRLVACDSPAALKGRIGGDVITIKSTDRAALRDRLASTLQLHAEAVDDVLRVELTDGGRWVPRIIEAAPHLVDSIAVCKPTLEDVFVRLTGRGLGGE